MRILVTGGAGFIGSNVARLLCDIGHDVMVLDDLRFGHRELVDPRCRFVPISLDDGRATREVMEGIDAVMHFAASSIIARSFSDPLEYVQNNLVCGANLLEAMRAAGTRHIVFSSSASVYGEPVRVPVQEEDLKSPLQLYGATKLAFENLLHGYYYAFGIQSVSLRYFNAYGPGDLQEPVTRAVPAWVRAALSGQPITLYWGGKQYRDYVFVEDIAQAHILALMVDGLHAFNVGTGQGVLMSDIIVLLEDLHGRSLEIIDRGERPGDPMRLVADTDRIVEQLGWHPLVTLREGLAKTIDFYERFRYLWDSNNDGSHPPSVG